MAVSCIGTIAHCWRVNVLPLPLTLLHLFSLRACAASRPLDCAGSNAWFLWMVVILLFICLISLANFVSWATVCASRNCLFWIARISRSVSVLSMESFGFVEFCCG